METRIPEMGVFIVICWCCVIYDVISGGSTERWRIGDVIGNIVCGVISDVMYDIISDIIDMIILIFR